MAVIQLAERQGEQQRRMRQVCHDLGVDGGRNMFGDAYARVISDRPDVTSDDERFALAKAIASNALSDSMRYLSSGVAYTVNPKQE